MAKEIALGLVIGGAVGASLGKAFGDTQRKIADLQHRTQQTKLWHNVIGETQRLQREFADLNRVGSAAADGVRKKIDGNLRSLREAGFAVDQLDRHYQRLGRTARGLDLQIKGRERIGAALESGKAAIGDATKLTLGAAAPVMVSAEYQAIVRDIAIKGGVARTGTEAAMSRDVLGASESSGMARNEVAGALNVMVGAGMDLTKARGYLKDAAKFSVGQGSEGSDTARMINALEQNAKIEDAAGMRQALNSIAYLGKAGSFESSDMARWFPELLAEMQKLGIVGQESVTSLGAMLQVEMKTAGSADQAANNMKNWFSKIGSEETKKQYKDAGVDYEAKMREAMSKGWNTVESSFVLARAFVEKVNPAKAKQIEAAAANISTQADPAKQKAMMEAFAETMKTGDLFSDMQVKAALTAYMQNAELYNKLKRESKSATQDVEKDLADRRDASKQVWSEVGQAWNDALRSMGDAMRPLTDGVGRMVASIGTGIGWLAEKAPMLTAGLTGVAASFVAFKGAMAAWNLGRGVFDLARGGLLARAGRLPLPGKLGQLAAKLGGAAGIGGGQPVFVTNWPSGFGGGGLGLPEGPQGGAPAGAAGKKPGLLGRAWQATKRGGAGLVGAGASVVSLGRVALMAPTLTSIGGLGAAGVATSGAMVAGAGAVGYGVGHVMNKGMGAVSGWASDGKYSGDGWLGARLFDRLNRDDQAKLDAPITLADVNALRAKNGKAPVDAMPNPQGKAAAAAPNQQLTFAPNLTLTVQGDVKDPRLLATELMPHMRKLFDDYQAQAARGSIYDRAHL